jgi:hypothetical protein
LILSELIWSGCVSEPRRECGSRLLALVRVMTLPVRPSPSKLSRPSFLEKVDAVSQLSCRRLLNAQS